VWKEQRYPPPRLRCLIVSVPRDRSKKGGAWTGKGSEKRKEERRKMSRKNERCRPDSGGDEEGG